MKKWFYMNSEVKSSCGTILGPFSEEDIRQKAKETADLLIWGRGLKEWLSLKEWETSLKEVGVAITEVPDDLKTWKFRDDQQEWGPFLYKDLIESLRLRSDFGSVYIFEPASQKWTSIFDYQKIVNELSISRRVHARVPIMGLFRFTSKESPAARVISVSEGGLGLTEVVDCQLREQVSGVLSSPHLYSEIVCNIEFVFMGNDGSAGAQFVSINSEATAALIEYVNKFKNLGSL